MYNPIVEVEIARQRYEEFAREAEMLRQLHAGAPKRPGILHRMLAGLRDSLARTSVRNGPASGNQASARSFRDCQPQC